MSEDNGQPEAYALVMPLVSVVTNGGPHDDDSYVAGWRMGALDAILAQVGPEQVRLTIETESRAQADLIAMRHDYAAEFNRTGIDEYLYLHLTKGVGIDGAS